MERPEALQERVFNKLFEAVEIAKFTKEQYEAYEESLKVYRDWQNTIATAESKGWEEGQAEGRLKERKENAFNLKKLGVLVEIISEATGLSVKEIELL
ncbi:hypothetical protein C799_02463 [Bacteroides thetaiotaomicron dnLKV9]|jgi:hypothetical protein|uniref:Transposase (putative) YhgA-like domain-containing protein n=1 Tax=Bacteroides thetaiotaomicron dnLKV9 TaxID=1235785 RepID=R9H9N1_BACT4|nr:hypothetical protein C799_02463 [Bacteroides thetaiotaomicron dnLKV9]